MSKYCINDKQFKIAMTSDDARSKYCINDKQFKIAMTSDDSICLNIVSMTSSLK